MNFCWLFWHNVAETDQCSHNLVHFPKFSIVVSTTLHRTGTERLFSVDFWWIFQITFISHTLGVSTEYFLSQLMVIWHVCFIGKMCEQLKKSKSVHPILQYKISYFCKELGCRKIFAGIHKPLKIISTELIHGLPGLNLILFYLSTVVWKTL